MICSCLNKIAIIAALCRCRENNNREPGMSQVPPLPASFPPTVAAHLLHVSRETFEDLRSSGVLPAGRRGRVSREAIEALLGRALTAEEILIAENKRESR